MKPLKGSHKLHSVFNSLDEESISAVDLLHDIFDWLRPSPITDIESVSLRITELEDLLWKNPDHHRKLTTVIERWMGEINYFQAFSMLGLFPRRGFLPELLRRFYEHLNPSPLNQISLADVFHLVFHKSKDTIWISALPDNDWLRLFNILCKTTDGTSENLFTKITGELLYSMEMLSIWVASEELEPDLVRLDRRIVARDSSFLGLQREIYHYCRNYESWMKGQSAHPKKDTRARVILKQCAETTALFRKQTLLKGISIPLSYLLERLDQTLKRIHDILDLLDTFHPEKITHTAVSLFRKLAVSSKQHRSMRALLQANIKLISRNITENTSDHGEHYITRNRKEYFAMFRSGAGGGIIIALMALIKIYIGGFKLAPFPEMVWVSLNYGLGFMLIHFLHMTVATKQPAMTASRLSHEIEKAESGGINPTKIAVMLMQLSRSQFVAVVGNVSVALSLSSIIALVWVYLTGNPILGEQERNYLLFELTPFASLALVHACMAGVWLFMAGIISGFFDNWAAYIGLKDRFKEHPLIRRILPEKTRTFLANYLNENYGTLVGSFMFGLFLGGTAWVGTIIDLPLGIRHVAFSSANLGFAAAVEFPGWLEFGRFSFYLIIISFCNLWVSFGLAFYIALKSRNVTIKRPFRIIKVFLNHLKSRPLSAIFPPAD